jgi:hypothetical protein
VNALEPDTGRKKIFVTVPSAREFTSNLEVGTTDIATALPTIIGCPLREIKTHANRGVILGSPPLTTETSTG